jgi:quinol monooxygenase YgiN
VYGLISKLRAQHGQREALIHVLLEGSRELPGCLHYSVGKDIHDEHVLWVVETWESAHAHQAGLALPPVIEAIARGRPLIASIERRIETVPVHAATVG